MIGDLKNYSLTRLSSQRRARVRKSLARNDLQLLDDPTILLEQGCRINREAGLRTRQPFDATAALFRTRITRRWDAGPGFVVAGARDDRLAGYLTAHVIGDRAYLEDVYIGNEGLRWQVGMGPTSDSLRPLGTQDPKISTWGPGTLNSALLKPSR